jgi:hypothetical protein
VADAAADRSGAVTGELMLDKVDIGSRNLNDMRFEVQAPANSATVLGN